MSTASKSEGAKKHESNQPAPASDPVVEEGGEDYKPPTKAAAEPVEETDAGAAGVSSSGTVGKQEIDGLDQDNILDDEKGVQTRGVEQDVYKEERKLDEVLGDD